MLYIPLFTLSSGFLLNWESLHGLPGCVICAIGGCAIDQPTSYHSYYDSTTQVSVLFHTYCIQMFPEFLLPKLVSLVPAPVPH